MSSTDAGPAYRVVTERLVIRCWSPADAVALKKPIDQNLDHLRAHMPWARREPTTLSAKIEQLRSFRGEFDLGTDFVYGIFDPSEAEVLGGTGLHPRLGLDALEIGYWIAESYTHRGLAAEAAGALTKVAFEVNGVERVEIHCSVRNLASAGVPRKLGFVHEATLRQRRAAPGDAPADCMVWSMLRDEYENGPLRAIAVQAFDAAGFPLL